MAARCDSGGGGLKRDLSVRALDAASLTVARVQLEGHLESRVLAVGGEEFDAKHRIAQAATGIYPRGQLEGDVGHRPQPLLVQHRSEKHPSELQSLMRNSNAGLCLKTQKKYTKH